MKKLIIGFILPLTLLGFIFASDFKATEKNVKPLGRTHFDDGILWNCFSATGAAFTSDSSKVEVTLCGDSNAAGKSLQDTDVCRVGIFVDGKRTHNILMINQEEKILIYDNNAGTHEIKIVKLSESTSSVFGIKNISVDDGKIIEPVKANKLKIEFIGDSITCGYGVDDENITHHFSTQTEDSTKTYAYKTAARLNADYSMVSCSGWGVVSGFSGDGKINADIVMKLAYEKLGFGWSKMGRLQFPQTVSWDFSRFQPDIVVINLGTNDGSYTRNNPEKCRTFENGYIDFLKMVRKNNPNAKIVCTLGMMGADLYPNIVKAVNNYIEETGDKRVYSLKLPNATTLAADWHPAEKSHENAANVLVAELEKILR